MQASALNDCANFDLQDTIELNETKMYVEYSVTLLEVNSQSNRTTLKINNETLTLVEGITLNSGGYEIQTTILSDSKASFCMQASTMSPESETASSESPEPLPTDSNYNEPTIKDMLSLTTQDNTISILGDLSSDIDAFFSINRILFNNKLQAYAQDDTQLEDLISEKNIIIIGGPCVNSRFWKEFSNETCEDWPYQQGQALVKSVRKDGQNVLLISGTTREDTFNIVEKLVNSPGTSLFQKDILEFEGGVSNYSSLCKTTTDYCLRSSIGMDIPFTSDNTRFTLELKSISKDKNTIIILIDNEEHTLTRGQKVNLQDIELTFDNIDSDYATAKAAYAYLHSTKRTTTSWGSTVTPNDEGDFNVDTGLYFVKFISDDKIIRFDKLTFSGSSINVNIDGEDHSIEEGESINVGDVKLTLKKADSDIMRAFFDFERI